MKHTRIAMLSDVHGNSPALRDVLKDVEAQGCSQIFVLGDIMNGIDPQGCVRLLRERSDVTCIKGNAEHYVLTPDLDAFPKRHEPLYAGVIQLIRWWQAQLTDEDLRWLQGLPDLIRFQDACLVHDSPAERMYPEQRHVPGVALKYQELCYHGHGLSHRMSPETVQEVAAFMRAHGFSRVYCGHTHVPYYREDASMVIGNAGGTGFTLDGDPRPSWLLVEESPDGTRHHGIRRVAYDIEQTVALVDARPDYADFLVPNRREAYKMMLRTGIHWRAHLHS